MGVKVTVGRDTSHFFGFKGGKIPKIMCENLQDCHLLTEYSKIFPMKIKHFDVHQYCINQGVKNGKMVVL